MLQCSHRPACPRNGQSPSLAGRHFTVTGLNDAGQVTGYYDPSLSPTFNIGDAASGSLRWGLPAVGAPSVPICAMNWRESGLYVSFDRVYSGEQQKDQMSETGMQIDFSAPAALIKWPSINNERARAVLWPHPYLVIDGTLDECIGKFLEMPAGQRHLYEIHTTPQTELVTTVMSAEHIVEIVRLRDFL